MALQTRLRRATLGSLVALVVALAACQEPESPAPVATPPGDGQTLSDADWPAVHPQAERFIGRTVSLSAHVYADPAPAGNGLRFLGWVDLDNDQLSTAFAMPSAPPELVAGAFVRVDGVIEEMVTLEDSQGRAIAQPLVRVTGLLVTDRIGIRPAYEVVPVDRALMQFDVRITLELIEFAREETRVHFTVANGGDGTVGAFPIGLDVEQAGVEHPAVVARGSGVPPPRGRVAPGSTERGAFQFPPLDPEGGLLTVRWEGAWVEAIAHQFQPWVWVVDPKGAVIPAG